MTTKRLKGPPGRRDRRPPGYPVSQLLVWGVPRDVMSGFKARCVHNRETMKQAIIRMMREYGKC